MIGRAEPPGVRRRREAARRDLPHVVGLLAAALRAGPAARRRARRGRRRAARSGRGPAGRVAAPAAARRRPGRVWAELAADPELGAARAAPWPGPTARGARGAAVERLADELARAARAEVEDRARAVGVKAALPLGLCLLPSFLLLGIVPWSPGCSDRCRLWSHAEPAPSAPPGDPRRPALHRPAPRPLSAGARPAELGVLGRTAARRRRHMHRTIRPDRRDERGITTAEYAVGTAAGAGLAGLLYKLLTGGFGDQLLRTLFDHVLGLLGIG